MGHNREIGVREVILVLLMLSQPLLMFYPV